jgi:hypothetical protein
VAVGLALGVALLVGLAVGVALELGVAVLLAVLVGLPAGRSGVMSANYPKATRPEYSGAEDVSPEKIVKRGAMGQVDGAD